MIIKPLYRKHLCNKYQWEDSTYRDIDWEYLHRAVNRKKKDRVILTKYLNDIASVRHMVHSYETKYPKQCPSSPGKKWRSTFLDTLCKTLTNLDTPDDVAYRQAVTELMTLCELKDSVQPHNQ